MQKNRLITIQMILSITLMMISISCKKDEENNSLNLKDGIILYMPPPDNCNDYVIKTSDNLWYKPSTLGNDYKTDSLLISFDFDSTDNFHDCGLGGSIPVVDLTHIEKR